MLLKSSARNSFLYRFTAVNIFGLALLGAAFQQGWINQIVQADSSHITIIIGLTFLFGLIVSTYKAIGINNLWNRVTDRQPSMMRWLRDKKPEVIGLRLSSDIQIVHHVAVLVLLMGISGTMIGIIMALKSTEAFAMQDQASMVAAIVMLFKGVYVKFYASLVGIMGHMWILNNHNMLTSMSRRLLARMIGHA